MFNPDGTELFNKPGDVSNVTFTSDEIAKMKGCILTHNHPNRTPFSPEDISFMFRHDLSEMRVVITGGVYVLQRTKRTSKKEISIEKVTDRFYDAYDEETIRILSERYRLNYRLEVDQDD